MKNLYQTKPLTKAQIALNRKWIEALRSGEYKQTKGQLFDGTGYCCLGVACVLAGHEPVKRKSMYVFTIDEKSEQEAFVLLPSVAGLLGFATENGAYAENDALSADNDGGKTFQEIADIIERQLERKIAKDKGK